MRSTISRRSLQAMPQTAATARHLAHHLFAQGIALAFRLLVLLGQFNHLLLQFHQPTIRLQVVADRFSSRIFVPVPSHVL